MTHYCPECGRSMPHPAVAAHHCPGDLAAEVEQAHRASAWATLNVVLTVVWYALTGLGGGLLLSAWIFGPN